MENNLFHQHNHVIARKVISPELASFVYSYFLNKRLVCNHLLDHKYLSPFDESWGTWKDEQIPNTYSHYGDVAMETLLVKLQPIMSKITALDLIPCYSYARIYKKGDELKRHKDRPSCEISTTLNLGGDSWPIFLEPSGEEGKPGEQVNLEPGDMLIYKGNLVEHWRLPFEGSDCCQVFLHYNNKNGEFSTSNINDFRPMLGLPGEFRNL